MPFTRARIAMCIVLLGVFSCTSRNQNQELRSAKGTHTTTQPNALLSRIASPKDIEAEIGAGFENLESTWFSGGPSAAPNMEAFVQGLLELAKTDPLKYARLRTLLIERAQDTEVIPKAVALHVRLAVHDRQAWLIYFDDFSQLGTPDPALKDSLVPVLLAMPKELRNELYRKIRECYGSAMTNKYNLTTASLGERKGLSPKRAIDAFVRNTVDAAAFFKGATTHETVKQGYRAYMNFKREVLFQNTAFCEYNADDVIALLGSLQKMIGTNWTKFGPRRGFGPDAYRNKAFLLLMGSFVNCHAQLAKDTSTEASRTKSFDPEYSKSDIDMYVSPASMIDSLRQFEGKLYKAFVSETAQKFKQTNGLKARLQMHPYQPVEELDASTLSPIFLRLRDTDILLYVYPPLRYSDIPVDRELNPLPDDVRERLPQPLCYAIAGSCSP